MKAEKVTPATLKQMKERGEKLTAFPVYDYPFAKILDECGVDLLLVGDSLGVRVMGRKDNLSVTIEEMIYHTQAVVRAVERAIVVTDMPFMSCEINVDEAKRNAGRLMKEGGADAVKVEGGVEIASTIRALVSAGIPVMGHIGFSPQSMKLTGLRKVRGTTEADRQMLLKDARAVEEAGAFLVSLVLMAEDVAAEITRMLKIPTSGIGAGPYCDGCALVLYDLLGLTMGSELPKHVKRYVNLKDIIADAVKQFIKEVKQGSFPDSEHSYK